MVFEYFGHFTLDLIHCACNVIDYKLQNTPKLTVQCQKFWGSRPPGYGEERK
jgi:hypothetical protein